MSAWIWLSTCSGADRAGIPRGQLHTEIVLGGWSPKNGRMMATAYAKSADGEQVIAQALEGGLASPGDPLRGRPASFEMAAVLHAGKLQMEHSNRETGRLVAGGRLLVATLKSNTAVIADLGSLQSPYGGVLAWIWNNFKNNLTREM